MDPDILVGLLGGGSILLTVIIVIISVVCSCVLAIAPIALIFWFYRNQQQKAQALMETGKPGEATILSLQDTGMRINDDPRVQVVMEVRIPGYPPYQVAKTVTLPLIRMSQVQVGAVVNVMADPTQPNNPDKVGLLLR